MPALDTILPVVLVGGKSRRFGRDKLQEPVGADPARPCLLVDVAIRALRRVFGRRVAICGQCALEVRCLADAVIEDVYPGAGPLGGISSALAAAVSCSAHGVFVLAGDLPGITGEAVRAVLSRAETAPDAWVVAARSDVLQPCIALYRPGALPVLRSGVTAAKSLPLHTLLESLGPRLATSPIDPRAAANVNTPEELSAFAGRA